MGCRELKNRSFGVCVSSEAAQSVPSDDRRRAFFQTTKGSDMRGMPLAVEHRPKSIGAIANMVSNKSSYMQKTVALADRSWSTQVTEHGQKPFLDLRDNRLLYEMNKKPIPGIATTGPERPLNAVSAYTKNFNAHIKGQTRKLSRHRLSDSGKIIGLRGFSSSATSTSQERHCAFPVALLQHGTAPPSSLGSLGEHAEGTLRSQYQLDFALHRTASAPAICEDLISCSKVENRSIPGSLEAATQLSKSGV
mmetsp:Transcript_113769/g.220782  ORF Transcript_113769/g.220782 Transcript_113769/m.220782 type:complete len:250 (-) Transcript_113769:112-861(-)